MNSPIATAGQIHKRVTLQLRLSRLMPTSGALNEIAALDGLRALAILLVILTHITNTLYSAGHRAPNAVRAIANFGFTGVFLFFVLSGFLLFLPYARATLGYQPWPSARQFYLRRVLRILPLYYVVLLLLLLPNAGIAQGQPVSLLFGVFLFHDMRVDAFATMQVIDGPFWTLAIEWQFYLLLPWIALALAKLAGKRASRSFFLRLMGSLFALVALGLGIRWLAATIYYAGATPVDAPGVLDFIMALFYGVKGKYWEIFALGMIASILFVLVVEHDALSGHRRKQISVFVGIISIIGLAGCILWAVQEQRVPFNPAHPDWWVFLPSSGESWQILGEWAVGVCFMLLLLAVLFGAPIMKHLFSFAPLRFIGIISYSLYAWHVPLLTVLSLTLSGASPIHIPFFVPLVACVLLMFGSASYYLIERPFIRFRRAAHAAYEQKNAINGINAFAERPVRSGD